MLRAWAQQMRLRALTRGNEWADQSCMCTLKIQHFSDRVGTINVDVRTVGRRGGFKHNEHGAKERCAARREEPAVAAADRRR
jgi:hypothetical protein